MYNDEFELTFDLADAGPKKEQRRPTLPEPEEAVVAAPPVQETRETPVSAAPENTPASGAEREPEPAAVLWALLAAGAQLLLPAEKTALPEGAALAWAALRICLVTPLAEELAFRGGALYLLQPLGGAGAVVVQAVIFAALHGSWTARAYALGMGLIFGWAAQKAKSVWPGSALHIINNCLVFAARLAERGMG